MRRPRRRALISWCLGCGCLVALAPSSRAQSNHVETPEVRALILRGVQNVDRRDLEKSIATQATACKNLLFEVFCVFSKSPTWVDRHYLDREEFKRDRLRILVYYYMRGYRAATVDTSVTPEGKGGVRVTFDIHENEPTRVGRIAIEYDSTLISDKQRQKLTLLHAKDPLNLIVLDSMRVRFQNGL